MRQNRGIISRDLGPAGGSAGLALDWPRFRQDLPEIADQSLGINEALFLDATRGYEYPICGVASRSISDRLTCAEIEVSLAAIRAQKEGRPIFAADWWRFSQECPEIADQSLGVNGALFLGLIAARNVPFPESFPVLGD